MEEKSTHGVSTPNRSGGVSSRSQLIWACGIFKSLSRGTTLWVTWSAAKILASRRANPRSIMKWCDWSRLCWAAASASSSPSKSWAFCCKSARSLDRRSGPSTLCFLTALSRRSCLDVKACNREGSGILEADKSWAVSARSRSSMRMLSKRSLRVSTSRSTPANFRRLRRACSTCSRAGFPAPARF